MKPYMRPCCDFIYYYYLLERGRDWVPFRKSKSGDSDCNRHPKTSKGNNPTLTSSSYLSLEEEDQMTLGNSTYSRLKTTYERNVDTFTGTPKRHNQTIITYC